MQLEASMLFGGLMRGNRKRPQYPSPKRGDFV